MASAPARAIERGGAAARRVYNTLELRRQVLRLLNKRTLAAFLRVEKAATTSVAEVLYREVHTSMMSKMSRATPRRQAYCDAVRVLDRSPLARITNLHKIPPLGKGPQRTPIRFDPTTLTANLKTWRKKYPNLLRVDYLYPSHDSDDAYVVHLDADMITIELESHVQLELMTAPFVAPTLPATPTVEGMTFHHTFALRLIGEDLSALLQWSSDRSGKADHLDQWRRYLFDNKALDRRITSIDNQCYGVKPFNLSFEEQLAFISHRKASGAEPIAKYYLQSDNDNLTSESMLELSNALPRGLRVLHFEALSEATTIHTYEPQYLINQLDQAHPHLHELRLSYSPALRPASWSSPAFPLTGMASLRRLILDEAMVDRRAAFAGWLRRFGGDKCVIQSTYNGSLTEMEAFNAMVVKARK